MTILYTGRISQFRKATDMLKEHGLGGATMGFVASGTPRGADHMGSCEINPQKLNEQQMATIREAFKKCGIEEQQAQE
ncbi:hypothetical protein LQD23_21310 [Chromobacterium violaceum]|uniref:hypothetical protein n=1 Tax=Chromobacterium violaceum TaxID=536 RepID=UPI001E4DD3DD|nr:hypothetical protein [Chromobacterium violaceum]MCD0494817.1 hypothetical protein [Chromobacterium violaceum]